MDLNELLIDALDNQASDLHLSAGLPPMIRVDGDLLQLKIPVLESQAILSLLYDVMGERQRAEFASCLEVDFSFEIAEISRFRVNVFNQMRGVAAVIRIIPIHIPKLEELGLPPVIQKIAGFSSGLVLVTGPTGSGKSTTLAAIIDFINKTKQSHILTLEDPIEFVHESQNCLINQREIPSHTLNFSRALRHALREDPDVILVGELRDLETIRLALTAAETGHLVLATLHTSSATKAINRIIDVFPAAEKNLVRSMLAESLQAVIAQNLVKKLGKGRIAAFEMMLCTQAIRHLIRDDKIVQIYSFMQTGQTHGMCTLDQYLMELVKQNFIANQTMVELAMGNLPTT